MSEITISIVVPCLNEASEVLALMNSINKQSILPDELIWVDSGSSDDTKKIIKSLSTAEFPIKLIELEKAFPGKSRNHGIQNATGSHIAFLDCGTIPTVDWISNLKSYIKDSNKDIIWGKCQFFGETPVQTLSCAYANGQGSFRGKTIPGSCFRKEFLLINKIVFREDLRAAEDTLFRKEIEKVSASLDVSEAVITYTSYPVSLLAVIKKWFKYSQYMAISKSSSKHIWGYLLFFTSLFLLVFIKNSIAGILLFLYFILRGVIDPIRRSHNLWFKRYPYLFVIGPLYIFVVDITKYIGFLSSFISLRKR